MKFDVFTEMEYIARSAGTLILNIHVYGESRSSIN